MTILFLIPGSITTYTSNTPPPTQKEREEAPVSSDSLPQPLFSAIALCESDNMHYNEDGTIVRSWANAVGRYQIHVPAHLERAKSLGIDIFTPEGNEEYAILHYREEGTWQWRYSQHCWSKLI